VLLSGYFLFLSKFLQNKNFNYICLNQQLWKKRKKQCGRRRRRYQSLSTLRQQCHSRSLLLLTLITSTLFYRGQQQRCLPTLHRLLSRQYIYIYSKLFQYVKLLSAHRAAKFLTSGFQSCSFLTRDFRQTRS